MIKNNFIHKHNGPRNEEIDFMLKTIDIPSIDQLISETIPDKIRLKKELDLPEGLNEYEYLNHIKDLGSKNKIFKTYIGMGYYNTILPGVIQRNILENPGWYTAYTPYQAEISQGRLEALLNYQTMLTELTGMEIANSSLLDEGSSASEAMIMMYNTRSRSSVKNEENCFFVSDNLFEQTSDIIKTRALPLGIEVVIGNAASFCHEDKYFGAILQYPGEKGEINNYNNFVEEAHKHNTLVAVAADLLSLSLLTPPGEWGADIVVGSTQRFGIPMGYGGPHAGFFATLEKFKRNIPGRIIGISQDAENNRALRMALQTREQHIKREKATSNICTSQVLLAIMAGMYAVYHGPKRIKEIAADIHKLATYLSDSVTKLGYYQKNKYFFDTLLIETPNINITRKINSACLNNSINLRHIDKLNVGISIDETTSIEDINKLISIFADVNHKEYKPLKFSKKETTIQPELIRTSSFLTHQVFNSYHSETEMMRYIKQLEIKDLSLNRSMIPLGSCTMKLNAATTMFSLSWPEFGNIHPFVPTDQALGYHELIDQLEKKLCAITDFSAFSFQPNSGATGEYTGLRVIREHHKRLNQDHRNITLIPSSAHGTNPASAVMAGMKVVVVNCDDNGDIDLNDLKEKAELHKNNLSSIMITYPSTHGVFEDNICEVIDMIHEYGGQVYLDGANMNAQVGLTNPAIINADVCHLNLHKTFGIPHGGGGPGVGPIGVAKHLVDFLPTHSIISTGGQDGISAIASAPYGSALILPISYGYIKLLGGEGLKKATEYAILNANYIKKRLEKHYKILFVGKHNRVAHEMILDCNDFKKTAEIEAVDIAKRLMDYGFHAPTVAFPVIGTLMVEPTESESLSELDRFCDAMISIKSEIDAIIDGSVDKNNNVIKNAPHTIATIIKEEWELPYSRLDAAYPMGYTIDKYWPSVSKINDAYGDRNFVCSCEPVSNYLSDSDK